MNKKVIYLIVTLVGISLIGVITFQVFWIKNAIKVKEEQIGHAVNNAMNAVIKKLEVHKKFSQIIQPKDHQVDMIYYNDSSKDKTIISTGSDNTVTILNGGKTIINHPKKFHNSGNDVIQIIDSNQVTVLDQRFLDKLINDYQQQNMPLTERLNLAEIDSMLIPELKNNNIETRFEYAILDENQKIIYPDIEYYKRKWFQSSKHKAKLFPSDVFSATDQLVLYLPDYQKLLFTSLIKSFIYSIIFSVVIILTFSITLYIILKQKKLDDIKTDFINNMTHEFKTPIATINLAVDSLENPKVYPNKDQIFFYTDIIRQENKRMNSQVEGVLQMALIDKKELKLNLKVVDVNELVQKACDNIKLQIDKRNGIINYHSEATQPIILGDKSLIINVLMNLLDNAIKYSPESLDIKVVTSDTIGGVDIKITDNGLGMSKDVQDKIFDKFYRLPTGNIHNIKGFGLGLSFVKAIVMAHNGTINVKSEPFEGSTFKVFLPHENNDVT